MLKKLITKFSEKYSFQSLFVWLILYLVVAPFIEKLPKANFIFTVFITMVLFFAVLAIKRETLLFRWSIVTLTICLILLWLNVLKLVSFPDITNSLIMAVYISMVVYSFSKFVFTARVVNTSLICAALCLYLFIGTLWGLLYEILELIHPGSFGGYLIEQAKSAMEMRQHFQYFSFVTLTTLGYGDILPKTSGASALCDTEAILGQIFMAVLVARLVGIQVAQQFTCENRDDTTE